MTDSADEQPTAGLDGLGYEQARDELAEVVRRLEAGGTSLEESLALWERGEQLAAICQRRLDAARARLNEATGASGERSRSDDHSRDDEGVRHECR